MRFVSERLRHHKEWGKQAVAANGFSFKYAGENLQDDHEVALLACQERGICLQYGGWNPRRNEECIRASIAQSRGAAFEHAARGSRRNPSLLYKAVADHADEKMLQVAEAYEASRADSKRAARRRRRFAIEEKEPGEELEEEAAAGRREGEGGLPTLSIEAAEPGEGEESAPPGGGGDS
jgi:hypothetical protein